MPKKLSKEIFISRAKARHSDTYNYDKVIFKNIKTKVVIVCPTHGDFIQTPEAHMRGQGCPKCGNLKNRSHSPKKTHTFIEQANSVHNNRYDYSKVIYKNCMSKVTITCQEHGDFEQIPNNHLRGAGCPECARIKNNLDRKLSNKGFIKKALKIHKDKYIYDNVVYNKSKTTVKIRCKQHGLFEQTPDKHLQGQGCPKCSNSISKPEQLLVDLFHSLDISCIQSDRTIIKPYELDIVIPKFNLAIEYCGLHWHSEQALSRYKNPKKYHIDKYNRCKDKGYRLITIFEPEFILKYDILKSMLLAQCNVYKHKIGARQCVIKEVTSSTAKKFLNENHIQGYSLGNSIGLFYNEDLVSLMVFYKYKDYYDLTRFVNKKHYLVYGAFSRLLKYFLNNKEEKPIITFADKRYFNGNVYIKNGFKFVHEVAPSYYYFKRPTDLLHKRNFQHSKLKIRFNDYNPNLTEYQNCLNNGYDRIWDCGKIKYVYG